MEKNPDIIRWAEAVHHALWQIQQQVELIQVTGRVTEEFKAHRRWLTVLLHQDEAVIAQSGRKVAPWKKELIDNHDAQYRPHLRRETCPGCQDPKYQCNVHPEY